MIEPLLSLRGAPDPVGASLTAPQATVGAALIALSSAVLVAGITHWLTTRRGQLVAQRDLLLGTYLDLGVFVDAESDRVMFSPDEEANQAEFTRMIFKSEVIASDAVRQLVDHWLDDRVQAHALTLRVREGKVDQEDAATSARARLSSRRKEIKEQMRRELSALRRH